MNAPLTPQDVVRLLQEPSPEIRAEVASKVAQQLEGEPLSPEALRLAQDIAGALAQDVALTVRRALAESLRRARHLPHAVALRLAQDVDAVAMPILADSPVLTDADLVQILRQGSPDKQQAIAGRPNLAEPVCDAVADCAVEPAVVALMRNPSAHVGSHSLHRAIDRFAGSDAVKESMAHRASLPIGIAERLVALISDQMRAYLVSHHELPPATASDIVLRGRERALLQLSYGSSREELLRLLRQMHRHGRLTPTLVVRAVCSGDMAFFTAALAVMAQVPASNAELLVQDRGGRGLVSLYQKAGMPDRLLPLVQAGVEFSQGTGLDGGEHDLERYRARVISRVLTRSEGIDAEELDYLVDRMPLAGMR